MKKFLKAKRKFSLKNIFFIDTINDNISIMAVCKIKKYFVLFYNKKYEYMNLDFILLHEFGHLYLNHLNIYRNNYIYLYIFLYIYMILSVLFTLFINIIILSIIINIYNLYNIYRNHKIEYDADLFACKYVSKKEIYKQIYLFNIWNFKSSYTHPSSTNRINKIINKINKY